MHEEISTKVLTWMWLVFKNMRQTLRNFAAGSVLSHKLRTRRDLITAQNICKDVCESYILKEDSFCKVQVLITIPINEYFEQISQPAVSHEQESNATRSSLMPINPPAWTRFYSQLVITDSLDGVCDLLKQVISSTPSQRDPKQQCIVSPKSDLFTFPVGIS